MRFEDPKARVAATLPATRYCEVGLFRKLRPTDAFAAFRRCVSDSPAWVILFIFIYFSLVTIAPL